jgi:hypothetical protein
MLGMIERFRQPGGRTPELDALIRESQYRTRQAVNCLVVEDVAYLVIEELTIRNCWPTAVVFLSSHHVTLRANTIVGSTYPFFLAKRSDHFVIETASGRRTTPVSRTESAIGRRSKPKPKHGTPFPGVFRTTVRARI